MPEIAEVRTVRQALNNRVVGKTIIGIDTPYDKIIESDKKVFKKEIIGKTIKAVDNYGKWLFIILGEKTIMAHLRMEGKFFIKPSNEEVVKHEHIIIHLDDGNDLRYHDTRKFGKMILINTDEIYKQKEIDKLGIEPDHDMLTKEYLYYSFKDKNIPIKTLLLDQTIINGLGNIYADEVLFEAHINPLKIGKKITLDECERIKEACYKIITKATECGGSTIRSYTSSLGVYGSYQEYLKVHTREGKICDECASVIIKTRVGGRGTYYCPKCQK